MESIPKKIHSFWFGKGPKPALALRCMESWRRVLPDYEIKEWTESDYDVEAARYTREAYRQGKFAFVSDYARLEVLEREGGIYLDADVEMRKSFDPFLRHGAFLGFMYDCNLGTAVIGARRGHPLMAKLRNTYATSTNVSVPNNDAFTQYFIDNEPSFKLIGVRQQFDDVTIYPKEYFEFPVLWGRAGYSVHHFMGSWWRGSSLHEGVKDFAKRIAGRPGYWGVRTITHRRALRATPFRERYLADLRG